MHASSRVELRMNEATAPSRVLGSLVALAIALPLLADVPAAFSGGDVLRTAVLGGALTATLVLAGLQWTGPSPGGMRLAIAALPLAAFACGVPAAWNEGFLALSRQAVPWLALAALPIALVRALPDASARRVAEGAVRVAALAAIAWVAWDGIASWPRAAAGPFGRPGVAGPVVAGLGLALLGARLRRRPFVATAALGSLVALALALTRSRTAAVALAAGLCALAGLAASRPRTRRIAGGFGAALAIVVALFVTGLVPAPGDARTLEVRRGLVHATARLVAEAPLLGHGAGRYGEEILRVRDPLEARLEAGRRPDHAHNDLLHVAAENGILGALAFAAFVLAGVGIGVRTTRVVPESDRGACSGWTAALVALTVAGLGEGIWIDPAGVIVGIAALVFLGSRRTLRTPERTTPSAIRQRRVAWGLALVAGVTSWSAVRVARADRAYVRWLDEGGAALARGDLARADVLLDRHLVHGALALDPNDARAWYQRGVQDARRDRRPAAAEAFRAALRRDPGITEARLDLATLWEIEGRPADAIAVLQTARRFDPRRHDVALRLGHLALGVEPLPGEEDGAFDIETVLRRYNEAADIDPAPLSNVVARARVARRLGDARGAAEALAEARSRVGADPSRYPAELLFESFRKAEWEGAHEGVATGILVWGLRQRPTQAGAWRAEAERFLAMGRDRERAAKEALDADAVRTGRKLDLAPAERAYRAATLRLAALLLAGLADPGAELAAARDEADRVARREPNSPASWRATLVRYRALLAWVHLGDARDEELPVLLEAIAQRGDLLIEAAQVAQRVDASLARTWYALGHALLGAELLDAGELEHARRLLGRAVEDDPEAAGVRYAFARALARTNELDEAARHLVTALAQDSTLRVHAAVERDFDALRDRPRVRAALER